MRLIDAEALRAEYQAILDRGDMFCEYDIIGMLDNAPTVEERPQGEWILQYRCLDGEYYTCSQCNRMILVEPKQSLSDYPFCHCGADMRGKKNENKD